MTVRKQLEVDFIWLFVLPSSIPRMIGGVGSENPNNGDSVIRLRWF